MRKDAHVLRNENHTRYSDMLCRVGLRLRLTRPTGGLPPQENDRVGAGFKPAQARTALPADTGSGRTRSCHARLRHAASCRSTYSRIPPWWWYASSAGVSMRQVTRKVVTFPSSLVAVTSSTLRTLRPSATPLMS